MTRGEFKKGENYNDTWEVVSKVTNNNKVFKHRDGFITRHEATTSITNDMLYGNGKVYVEESDEDTVVKDTRRYQYDNRKRLVAIERYINPYTEEEYQNKLSKNELLGLQEPHTLSWRFEYDDKNRLVSVRNHLYLLVYFEYWDSGAVKTTTIYGYPDMPESLYKKLGIQRQKMYYNEDGTFDRVEFGEWGEVLDALRTDGR